MQRIDRWLRQHTEPAGKVITYTKFKLIKNKYAEIYIKRR